MQEGFIFNDTIANNIAPEDDTVDKKKLLYAVDMANIRSFIETLPLKYNTRIGNTGQGVSQGQKQRILIARAIYRNPDYLFFDEATKREFSTEGKGYPNPCGNFIQRHQAATQLDALLKANEAKGNVFIGNTIEEVAKKAGMDPATLKASADMMTKFAKQGRDDQFGKDKYYLRAVSEGPFYVVRGKLNTLTSLNGVKVNADLQVLDKNDHVIQGLYAIGHDAGGVYGMGIVLHNVFGLTLGYLMAKLFRLDSKKSRTVAIEVGMQNSGMAASFAVLYFNPAAAIPGAIFSVWHNISGSLIANYFSRRDEKRGAVCVKESTAHVA